MMASSKLINTGERAAAEPLAAVASAATVASGEDVTDEGIPSATATTKHNDGQGSSANKDCTAPACAASTTKTDASTDRTTANSVGSAKLACTAATVHEYLRVYVGGGISKFVKDKDDSKICCAHEVEQ